MQSEADADTCIEALRVQARGCARSGSPLYAALLERAADDADAGGPIARILDGWQGKPILDALPLRLMGAVHREVLAGRAPELAAFYASAGGDAGRGDAWPAFRALATEHEALLRERIREPVQTNEVQRAAALLPGFLAIAARTGLPLRCREIGASAGLLLLFDRFRYQLGPHAFGPEAAPITLDAAWEGPPPALEAALRVVDRAGCDLAPVDLEAPEARLRLASFLWPDQPERHARLYGAIELARRVRPRVDRAAAAEWLERELAVLPEATATVLYQSVVWWYFSDAERARVTALAEAAGARATPEAPFAWLRMEGAHLAHAELQLRLWPDGTDTKLAEVHWHGSWIRYTGKEADASRPPRSEA